MQLVVEVSSSLSLVIIHYHHHYQSPSSDFSHAFNVELKKVQTENKAAWAVADKRKDIATTIRANLIAKKEASLRKAEVDKAEVSSSLSSSSLSSSSLLSQYY